MVSVVDSGASIRSFLHCMSTVRSNSPFNLQGFIVPQPLTFQKMLTGRINAAPAS